MQIFLNLFSTDFRKGIIVILIFKNRTHIKIQDFQIKIFFVIFKMNFFGGNKIRLIKTSGFSMFNRRSGMCWKSGTDNTFRFLLQPSQLYSYCQISLKKIIYPALNHNNIFENIRHKKKTFLWRAFSQKFMLCSVKVSIGTHRPKFLLQPMSNCYNGYMVNNNILIL